MSTEHALKSTFIHEAGHTIMAQLCGLNIDGVFVGNTQHPELGGYIVVHTESLRQREVRAQGSYHAGGLVAESIHKGIDDFNKIDIHSQFDEWAGDIYQLNLCVATELIHGNPKKRNLTMEACAALTLYNENLKDAYKANRDDYIQGYIRDAFRDLSKNWDLVEKLASELQNAITYSLTKDTLAEFFAHNGTPQIWTNNE